MCFINLELSQTSLSTSLFSGRTRFSDDLTIISAFMTQPATSWLAQLIYNNKPKVQLVGRFTPIDFAKGASDLNALRNCINNGYQVKALANLHAKIYQIDNDTIFNGSANLTGKGLALVNNGNLESCSRVNACEQSKAFINKIVESATELSINTLDKMQTFLEQLDDCLLYTSDAADE